MNQFLVYIFILILIVLVPSFGSFLLLEVGRTKGSTIERLKVTHYTHSVGKEQEGKEEKQVEWEIGTNHNDSKHTFRGPREGAIDGKVNEEKCNKRKQVGNRKRREVTAGRKKRGGQKRGENDEVNVDDNSMINRKKSYSNLMKVKIDSNREERKEENDMRKAWEEEKRNEKNEEKSKEKVLKQKEANGKEEVKRKSVVIEGRGSCNHKTRAKSTNDMRHDTWNNMKANRRSDLKITDVKLRKRGNKKKLQMEEDREHDSNGVTRDEAEKNTEKAVRTSRIMREIVRQDTEKENGMKKENIKYKRRVKRKKREEKALDEKLIEREGVSNIQWSGNREALMSGEESSGDAYGEDAEEEKIVEDGKIFVPNNISVVLASWNPPSIRISWNYGGSARDVDRTKDSDVILIDKQTKIDATSSGGRDLFIGKERKKLEAFRIIYHPTKSRYRMIHEVPPNITTLTLDGLVPNTEYELSIVALYYLPPSASQSSPSSRRDYSLDQTLSSIPSLASPSSSSEYKTPTKPRRIPEESASEPIKFISPDSEPGRFYRHSYKQLLLRKRDPNEPLRLKTDEVVIVVGVLLAWMAIIALFIKKWGKIRAIEPCQSYFSPEIYDIPLNKSLGLIKRSVDMSAQSAVAPTSPSHQQHQLIMSSGLPLVNTDSRRSLSALVSTLRRDSNNYYLSSPPSCTIGEPGAGRPRMNSVFVTPPTRPVTPYGANGNNGGSGGRASIISNAESPPRRFKSAEDLRSIVNEFTRRKSTLLMSPTYFMKKE